MYETRVKNVLYAYLPSRHIENNLVLFHLKFLWRETAEKNTDLKKTKLNDKEKSVSKSVNV